MSIRRKQKFHRLTSWTQSARRVDADMETITDSQVIHEIFEEDQRKEDEVRLRISDQGEFERLWNDVDDCMIIRNAKAGG